MRAVVVRRKEVGLVVEGEAPDEALLLQAELGGGEGGCVRGGGRRGGSRGGGGGGLVDLQGADAVCRAGSAEGLPSALEAGLLAMVLLLSLDRCCCAGWRPESNILRVIQKLIISTNKSFN